MPVRKQFTKAEREEIFLRDHYRCCKCNKNLKYLPDERVIDHKLPLSKGGTNDKGNLQLLCVKCDGEKADSILVECQGDYIKNRLQQLGKEADERKKRFFRKKFTPSPQTD